MIKSLLYKFRNKEYGSYKLRDLLNKNLIIGYIFSIAFFSFGLILYEYYLTSDLNRKVNEFSVVYDSFTLDENNVELPSIQPQISKSENKVDQKKEIKKVEDKIVIKEINQEKLPPKVEKIVKDPIESSTTFTDQNKEKDTVSKDNLIVKNGLDTGSNSDNGDTTIYNTVQEEAGFIGGKLEFIRWVQQNLTYPDLARKNKIEGTVYVEFVVSKLGKIEDVKIFRGRGLGFGCDQEVVRVINSSASWKPGKQNGIPVNQRILIPIKFKLPAM